MSSPFIQSLSPETEERIRRNPSLNIDSFILPTPFAADGSLEKDYDFSLVWEEEREILGFMEVWSDRDHKRLHICKQVTSPFGRAKGIGSAFLKALAERAPAGAKIDLFVWERQTETLTFYRRRGFVETGSLAWRALTFLQIEGEASSIVSLAESALPASGTADELGKIRHDAKKAIRLLSDMAGALSVENCSRIIEDINRETTALVNTLNLFRDSVQRFRTVNLKEIILDRIVPLVEHSPVSSALELHFAPTLSQARAHYLEAGRALVNLVSNALDAIREADRVGRIVISLDQTADSIVLSIEDNGAGIDPDRLARGPEGLPLFVGHTTKGEAGEGHGTRQIFAAFGPENITVESEKGKGSRWIIRLPIADENASIELEGLETRWAEIRIMRMAEDVGPDSPEGEIAAFIWKKRKLEILIWDLILQFARRNNVRELFRLFLSFRHGLHTWEDFRAQLEGFRIDTPALRRWLAESAQILRQADSCMDTIAPEGPWQAERFASYSQAIGRTVIFTLDPANGRFGATDRKLAEHADYVPWLGGRRDRLLRGEFFGELRNPGEPIQLGVWEIGNREDAIQKAALIREGAQRLLSFGLPPDKKLLLYGATWRRAGLDLDEGQPRTLTQVANLPDGELSSLIVSNDDEAGDYIFAD